MTKQTCIITDCPAYQHPCGCGWLEAGQPCGHSKHRDEWREATAQKEAREPRQMEVEL